MSSVEYHVVGLHVLLETNSWAVVNLGGCCGTEQLRLERYGKLLVTDGYRMVTDIPATPPYLKEAEKS